MKKSAVLVIIGIIAGILFSCRFSLQGPYRFSVVVPEADEILITQPEMESFIGKEFPLPAEPPRYNAVITVYKYSSGKDVFTISDETKGEVKYETKSGYIEAMVKITDRDKPVDVVFVRSEGTSRDAILKNLAEKVRKELNIPVPGSAGGL
jgi:hypothetical protein